jgi:hypothetical protein
MNEEKEPTGTIHKVFIRDALGASDKAMVIKLPDNLEQDRKLFEGVTAANELLRLELGRSQGSVTAEWTRVDDALGRPLLQLRLTDLFANEQVVEQFASEEFGDRRKLETRIHRMWGDLLRARSNGLLKSLEGIITQSGG